jgi:hypothetical protein
MCGPADLRGAEEDKKLLVVGCWLLVKATSHWQLETSNLQVIYANDAQAG